MRPAQFPKIHSPLPSFMEGRESWVSPGELPTRIPDVITWEPVIEIEVLPSTDDFEMVDRLRLKVDYSPAVNPDQYSMRNFAAIMQQKDQVRRMYPGPLPRKTLAFHRYHDAGQRFPILVENIRVFMHEYGIEPDAIRRRLNLYPRTPVHINYYINAFADAIGDRNLRRPMPQYEPWRVDRAGYIWGRMPERAEARPYGYPRPEPMSVEKRLKSLLEDPRNRHAMQLIGRFLTTEELGEFHKHLSVTVKAVPWFNRKVDVIVRVASAYNMNFEIDGVAIQGCMQAVKRKEICDLDVFLGTVLALKTNPEYVKQTMNFSPDFDTIAFTIMNEAANITPVLDQVNAQAEAEEGQHVYRYQWRAHFGRDTTPNEHSLYDMLVASAET